MRKRGDSDEGGSGEAVYFIVEVLITAEYEERLS